ncbi:UTP--glucose-1-phosphate uridylyltransferase GalU [Fructilactobacillus cliffordii]|uniref:UTP--glucose-1-phosphate uridylyltransferase n=1 Tax=Fructilactobacillus cliffordii TaxID=2940299 RepID=A0A9Q8ZWP9_9LACO|nr:UTP--glucose-1-phosphate uridylyltransferase GalU [Fructilactobacillus cliffordii]USS85867.1 UTP--glucose-1-phosphate uridylyltransferase GalU [Fructilactobacillus cliffordii]USS88936.1 UTP--glucose-1-phosphate uridylyltransferase GalU [Fructilactobacillus cliffordii]
MKKVTKAIIPAAGLGTRFLPETKAVPKEMLPVIDTPTIQYIVEEAKASGITDIVIVTGSGKNEIEDHFSPNYMLEENLESKGKLDMLKSVQASDDVKVYFVRQPYPKGLGDAVLTGKSFLGNEPFVVMLGDDLMTDQVPLTKQLINSYEKTGSSTLAVMRVPHEETSKYGVIDPIEKVDDETYDVRQFVEKPNPDDAPSDLAIIGRYLFTPEILDVLETTKPGKGNEVQLTDAIDTLNKSQKVYAHEFKGERFDTGNKLSWLKTNIQFGLKRPDLSADLKDYIIKLANELNK